MAGNYLLDTNIVAALFSQDLNVRNQIAAADEVSVPAIVLGELYHGAYNSSDAVQNLIRLEQFAAYTPVVPCDAETAKEYGSVRDELQRKGKPIPENDIWIAAVARQHNLVLATRDAHFAAVDALQVASW